MRVPSASIGSLDLRDRDRERERLREPESPGLDVLALQRGAGNAAVSRMLATTRMLQRRTEMDAAGPLPKRVVSNTGAIVLVGPQELYATPAKITEAAGKLQAIGSFVTLAPGDACAFDVTLARVTPRPAAAQGARPPRLQQLYSSMNDPDDAAKRERRKAAGNQQFNAERNEYGDMAIAEATTKFAAEVEGSLPDYATFSDCHRNTELVMGAEDEVALYEDLDTRRGPLPSMTKEEAGGFGRKNVDPATRGAYAWLAKAIPSFPAQLELSIKEAGLDPATSVVWQECQPIVTAIRGSAALQGKSLTDASTRSAALADPDYPKELWRLYRLIQDSEAASGALALIYGVNQGLSVRVGDGIAVVNDTYEKQAADVKMDAARRDVRLAQEELRQAREDASSADDAVKATAAGREQTATEHLSSAQSAEEDATKWNFHWVPVVLTDGDDYVLLENAAGDDADVNRFDTYRWRFKMFGPEQKLHDVSGEDTHTTEHYLTLPYTRAPEHAQAAPQAAVANGLTAEELQELRASPGAMKQMAMAKLLRERNAGLTAGQANAYLKSLLAA